VNEWCYKINHAFCHEDWLCDVPVNLLYDISYIVCNFCNIAKNEHHVDESDGYENRQKCDTDRYGKV